MLFLIPALYVAVAAYAIAAAVTMGLEIVIFFARVFDPRRKLRKAEARVERLSQEMKVVESRDIDP
jgi:peroxiredoxin family protein